LGAISWGDASPREQLSIRPAHNLRAEHPLTINSEPHASYHSTTANCRKIQQFKMQLKTHLFD